MLLRAYAWLFFHVVGSVWSMVAMIMLMEALLPERPALLTFCAGGLAYWPLAWLQADLRAQRLAQKASYKPRLKALRVVVRGKP